MMREKLSSRFGFLMLAAGSAVGLGNIWRFPYVAGRNGGAAFVLVYLAFLALLGFPLLMVELGIGRGAEMSLSAALGKLAPPRYSRFWRRAGAAAAAGCFVLMIYYTDVAGWLVKYTGDFAFGRVASDHAAAFSALVGDAPASTFYMGFAVALSAAICALGVVKGVERATKFMMAALFALLAVLAVRSASLPGGGEGLAFYLKPDWSRFMEHPWAAVSDAMGQAFFTLSLGIGSMTICGSYGSRGHSLVKESAIVIAIDTAVAVLAGLVVFPACAAFGIPYTEGPGLVFVALPAVFSQMPHGGAWGFLFFLFLSFAALTTVVAVFECLIAALMDSLKMKRAAATALTAAGVFAFSLPCIFFPRAMDWEDFAVSRVWLPLGALMQCVFAVNGSVGWGWENFRAAVSAGKGAALPARSRMYFAFAIPALVAAVFLAGFFR